jgi:hypothetical protein
VLVRAHLATGEDRFAEQARQAIAPLLPGSGSELVTQVVEGPILEETPGTPPGHILNGWMYGLWGLWDVSLGLEDAAAASAFATSLECLRAHLPAYDTGWWSLYGLYPHAMEDLAKPIYHRLHVDQLEAMHRLTGHADLRSTSERWREYDRPAHRVAAVLHKAAFAAADGRRRRRWGATT